MATTYPTTKQSVPNPTGTDLLDNSNAQLDHDYQHSTVNDTIEALQDKVGIDNDPNVDSFDYKLSDIASGDKAISSNGSGQTLTDITLTDPQINFGGDATGDMYYRNAGGATTRLPIGTSGQILQSNASSIPEWIANPATSDASTIVKGVVEEATSAEVIAGTGTGSTGARLFVNPSTLLSSGAVSIPAEIQTYTANDTWTKPTNAKSIKVECIGAGGGGAGPNGGVHNAGASGGGGGSHIVSFFDASNLAATVAITVGTGGTGGTNGNGSAGGSSSFGSHVTAFGGGGGFNPNSGASTSGGGGGGGGSVGTLGVQAGNASGGTGISTAGGNGINGAAGSPAEFGGGAGGGGNGGNSDGFDAGDSLYGAGGGGGSGGKNVGNTAGGAGGGVNSFSSGNGGAGGASGTNNGTAGTAGDSTKCGTGGGAGGTNQAGTGGNGGAGGALGGGGGAGGAGATGGTGGAGGRGEVRVTTYF